MAGLLARHFLNQLAKRYARPALAIDDQALAALAAHPWPGNVRELRNVLERAVLVQHHSVLGAADLALPPLRALSVPASTPVQGALSLEAAERERLVRALAASRWNVTQAARTLDISRDTLRYRMERHGLQK